MARLVIASAGRHWGPGAARFCQDGTYSRMDSAALTLEQSGGDSRAPVVSVPGRAAGPADLGQPAA